MIPLSIEKLTRLPNIDLGDIYLRAIEFEDYKDMYEYGSDDLVTKTLVWNTYRNIDDAKDSIEKVFLSRPDRGLPLAYAIIHKEDKKMIGTCDFHSVNWDSLTGEIGYVLNRRYWGQGYMSLVCGELIKFGFEYLGLNKIEIGHEINNVGSRRVIEKNGFKLIKTEYHERLKMHGKFYEITKEDYGKRNE